MGNEFNFLGVDSVQHFRFTMHEVHQIVAHLDLEERIETPNRYVIEREEALCLVLYRLSWPLRYLEVEKIFHRSFAALSTIFLHMVALIHENWKHILLFDHVRLTPEFLERCVAAVNAKGGHQRNCWSFIDGTHMKICRPGQEQQEFYSGHKHIHSLKYHAITSPDGMVVHFGGPFPGRRHDARMLTDSRIREYLAVHAVNRHGERLVVYGDEGYGRGVEVTAPFRGNDLTEEQSDYNESMRRPRLAAEWGFAFISNNWCFLNHYSNLRVGLSPIGLYVPIAALFSNLLRCFGRGNTTLAYFEMIPPTILEYLTPRALWDQGRVVFHEPKYFRTADLMEQLNREEGHDEDQEEDDEQGFINDELFHVPPPH
jgi:hypothetical protein